MPNYGNLANLGQGIGAGIQGYDQETLRQLEIQRQQQAVAEKAQQDQALATWLAAMSQGGGQQQQGGPPAQIPQGLPSGGAPPGGGGGGMGAPMPQGAGAPSPSPSSGYSPGMFNAPSGPQAAPSGPATGQPQGQGNAAFPYGPSGPIVPQPQAPPQTYMAQMQAAARRIAAIAQSKGYDPAVGGMALKLYADEAAKGQAEDTKTAIAQMQTQAKFDLGFATLQAKFEALQATLSNRTQNIVIQQGGAMDRAQLAAQVRKQIADANAAGQPWPDSAKTFFAQELIAGNLQGVNEALGFSRDRKQIMAQIIEKAQQLDPSFDGAKASAALAGFGGTKRAAAGVGAIAGGVAQGAQELQRFGPVIRDAMAKVDRTRFPTINAVLLEAKRQGGDPNVTQLASYIQSIKNAYVLVMTRSGRSTDQARARSDEIISPNMSISQLSAALDAMSKEAAVAQQSAGAAMQDVTQPGGPTGAAPAQNGAGGASPAPSGNVMYYDEQGNRIQ